ncbi:Protein of unknown function (DUF3808), putative [Trypanosoma equiperdum]|uniref:Tetratricopeptide repeat n=1 Tax=Trypanosoma equiperdum TaxID=5694 RepID=A0A1G4I9M3_TRYEQ|nr:Protein of unknown function (DUF3808), putative [Trypanosoma equiperdum]
MHCRTASDEEEHLSLHNAVEEAVHLTWNNNYERAKEILSRHKANHPRFSLEFANVFLVQTLMNSTNETREVLLDQLKEADALASHAKHGDSMFRVGEVAGNNENLRFISKSQRQKRKKEFERRRKAAQKAGEPFDDAWKLECDVIYAEALFMRAVGQLMMNAYFRGGINLRKAWGLYYKLIQQVEADTDDRIPEELKMCIKYGTGTFYTFLAFVPSTVMKVLSVVGFVVDRELGERYLMEVFESDGIRSPFAALVLCTFYLFLPTGLGKVEETLVKAKRILDKMNERYDANTYFYGYSNFYHRKRGEIEQALETIEKAEANAERVGLVPTLVRYLRADTLFMDLRFEEAKQRYTSVIEHLSVTKQSFAYTGQVVLSLAACCVMLGDDNTAVSWLKKVGSMYNPKSKNDANSPKFASRVLNNNQLLPLCGVYMLYINRDLAHMNVNQAERVLMELQRVTTGKDMSSPEAMYMHTLFVAVIQKGCGRTDEAEEGMKKIFANEKSIPRDSMVLPYAYYEMGELEFRRGRIEEAKRLFTKGQSIPGDGNETLMNRYRIALKQLKQKTNEG